MPELANNFQSIPLKTINFSSKVTPIHDNINTENEQDIDQICPIEKVDSDDDSDSDCEEDTSNSSLKNSITKMKIKALELYKKVIFKYLLKE